MKRTIKQPHQPCMIFFKNLWSEVDSVERCPLFALSQEPEAVAAALIQPALLPQPCLSCLSRYLDFVTSA